VLPKVWEDEKMATLDRAFPSDHGAVVIDLEWKKMQSDLSLETKPN
jgi:hypothetical protein